MNLFDAVSAAKAAYDLAAIAVQARDEVKTQAAMTDLRERLWDMSNTGLSQVQALHSLELETQKLRMQLSESERAQAELQAKLKEDAQYKLAEIRPGIWAHTLIEDMETPVETRPNFCAACYANGKKVPLRYISALGDRTEMWRCLADGAHTYRNFDAPRKPHNRSAGWMG